jgi:DNA-binding IclR family transcriptional regulator
MDDHSVIGRTLEILSAIAVGGTEPVSLAEVTRRTDLPKATVRRIADNLAGRQVLAKGVGGYRLGPASLAFAHRAHEAEVAHTREHPLLVDLFRAVGGLVWLAEADDTEDGGREIRLTDSVFGRAAAQAGPTRWPRSSDDPATLATALGAVALSDRPEVVARLMSAPPVRLTPYSPTTPRWFLAAVARAKTEHYAVEHEQVRLGWSCLAVRVPERDRMRVLGVCTPTHEFRLTPFLSETRAVASEVARAGVGQR